LVGSAYKNKNKIKNKGMLVQNLVPYCPGTCLFTPMLRFCHYFLYSFALYFKKNPDKEKATLVGIWSIWKGLCP